MEQMRAQSDTMHQLYTLAYVLNCWDPYSQRHKVAQAHARGKIANEAKVLYYKYLA